MPLHFRSESGDWIEVPGASYRNEEELRTLLVENPDVLPLEDLPGIESTAQVTIGREAPLGSGFVDVLWVDVEGRLTIVEVKLRSNPEVRREVLAQALSYGAFLEGMEVEELVESIARPYLHKAHGQAVDGMDLPNAVATIAGTEVDHEAFHAGLTTNLSQGDFRILIVVDEPHPQLRRSVAYVNRHSDFEIYLVEVGFYRSEDRTHEILAPRILDVVEKPRSGRSSAGRTSRAWDIDAYFEQVHSRHPELEKSLRDLHSELERLADQGLVDLRFGSGKTGNLVVDLAGTSRSVIWVRAHGSIQFPKYSLRHLGYTKEEVTNYMDQIAEVSGAPPAKYRVQQEPQIVSPEAIVQPGVVDRVAEVVETIGLDFAGRSS